MTARIIQRAVDDAARRRLEAAGVDPLLARLYAARKVADVSEVSDSLQDLLPFHTLKNIGVAAKRLAQAVRGHEPVVVAADYDADGATACALMVRGLREMGGVADFVVPNRFADGYGLSVRLVDEALNAGAKLLVTVDNGIAAAEAVNYARSKGLDVLVTDHHLHGETLPDCIIVNPNQPGDGFPAKSTAGVGVAFYVLSALRIHLRETGFFGPGGAGPNMAQWLDLVALGTVADVVPLERNNRILVAQGLKRIRAGKTCAGIRALFEVSGRDMRKAQAFDLGFAVGPRLNAAGRLEDMRIGIDCLLTDDEETAAACADELDRLNRQRRTIESGVLDEAEAAFDADEIGYSVVAYSPQWHQGVVGIVAGRLRERFHRPALVFARAEDGMLRGSGRSISGLHLRDALDMADKIRPGLMEKFGGHAMAAGLSIPEAALDDFRPVFEEACRRLIADDDLTAGYLTDGSLPGERMDIAAAKILAAGVWGQGFAAPLFCDTFEVCSARLVGTAHTKAVLKREGVSREAMIFRCTDPLPDKIRAVYRPTANEWRGREELQLYIDYWEPA